MNLRTLANADIQGKRVLLRTDFNVPIQDGVIQDKTRLQESLPTIRLLLQNQAKVIIVSHLGRPKGVDESLRLNLVASSLGELLGLPVTKLNDCIGSEVEAAVAAMLPNSVLLLENVRFHPEEEKNDPTFSAELAKLADVYVSDAFGTVHRAHASTEGVAHILPAYAGLLVEKEINALSRVMENPTHPLCLVVGGAKIDTKIGILERFLDLADNFIIGGALANTFLKAQGKNIGASLCEDEELSTASEFLKRAGDKTVLLPSDVVVASEVSANAATRTVSVDEVGANDKILDFGPHTLTRISELIQTSKTVIWNGPIGLYEMEPFSAGTRGLAKAIAQSDANSILGGGDTIDAIHHFGYDGKEFTHISTGGGAMLEFLEGKELPGVKVILQ